MKYHGLSGLENLFVVVVSLLAGFGCFLWFSFAELSFLMSAIVGGVVIWGGCASVIGSFLVRLFR